MSLEQELRATLRRAAADVGPAHPDAGMREAGMRVLAHRRSRRRSTVLSVGLAVLVIGVGIPGGQALVESSGSDAAAPASTAEATPEPTPPVYVFDGPTRGSLAGDTEFVEAMRQIPWTVPVDARRVVYAGEVTGRRYVLVIGDPNGAPVTPAPPTSGPTAPTGPTDDPSPQAQRLTGGWFAGPAGATPDEMELAKDIPISLDRPESIYNPTTGGFIVIAAPGDLIAVSPRPEVAADATVSRTYVEVETSDGVAETVTQPAPLEYSLTTVQYRVSRPGEGVVLDDVAPSMVDDLNSPVRPQIEIDNVRPPGSAGLGREERARLQNQAGIMLTEFGLPMDEVAFQQQYYGPITSLPSSLPFSVITMTFPSGAVLISASRVADEPECDISGISPARASGEPASLALRCDLVAASSLVILAPSAFFGGYALVDGDAEPVRVELDRQGVAMVAPPKGASSVQVYSADGLVVDEVPILTA